MKLVKATVALMLAMFPVFPQDTQTPTEEEMGIHTVGNDLTMPQIVRRTTPSYTGEALRARVEGTVVLQVIVRKDGRVDSFKTFQGLGYGLEERTIQEIVNNWRFRPGTFKGEPVDVLATIEVNFNLRGSAVALIGYVEEGKITAVRQELLDEKTDVNKKDRTGKTALMAAARGNHTPIVTVLLDAGAKVNTKDKQGRTALMMAVLNGHMPTVQELLKARAKVNTKDKQGRTALMMAVFHGHISTAQELLKARAKVNEKDKQGKTALMMAAHDGHESILRALIDAGANVNERDKNGGRALMFAAMHGHTEIVELLRNAGAKE